MRRDGRWRGVIELGVSTSSVSAVTMNAKPDSYRAAELVERAYPAAARASTAADSPVPTPAPTTSTVARRHAFAFDRWLPAGEATQTKEFLWA